MITIGVLYAVAVLVCNYVDSRRATDCEELYDEDA